MIVASVDTVTGDAVLFGLPRNMTGFTFSDGTPFPGLGKGLLNEVYAWGIRHPEMYGGIDPGASAIKDVAANLLGIPIDYFVLVDMAGFAEMVDVLGGVTISVGKDVVAPIYNRENGSHVMTTIAAGSQLLDGDLALAYARSRTGSNDYSRMARQRCVLTALAEQIDPLALLPRLGGILDTVNENVTTDISPEQIPALVNLAPLLSSERVLVVGFARGYRLGSAAEGSLRPDIDRIRAAVQQALTDPEAIDSDLGMKPAAEACG
jgi:LCP family protein required for cell wall assembly